jgi:hypothetical protein
MTRLSRSRKPARVRAMFLRGPRDGGTEDREGPAPAWIVVVNRAERTGEAVMHRYRRTVGVGGGDGFPELWTYEHEGCVVV